MTAAKFEIQEHPMHILPHLAVTLQDTKRALSALPLAEYPWRIVAFFS
jgi:hypothetical protein